MRTFIPFQFVSVRYLLSKKKETEEEEQRERAAKPRHKPKKEERQVAGSRRSAYQVAEKEVVLRYIKSNRFVLKRNRKIMESPSQGNLKCTFPVEEE